jgi:hypothetical protein
VGTSREIREALDFFGIFEVVAADGGVELAGSDLKRSKFLCIAKDIFFGTLTYVARELLSHLIVNKS